MSACRLPPLAGDGTERASGCDLSVGRRPDQASWHANCWVTRGNKEHLMAKAGQHHNSGLSSSKPRGHETSRGVNRPNRSQEITTGSYKKQETYRRQAAENSGNTSDIGAQAANREPWNDDIRDQPDTATGSTRARESSLHRRSGSDSNADAGTR